MSLNPGGSAAGSGSFSAVGIKSKLADFNP